MMKLAALAVLIGSSVTMPAFAGGWKAVPAELRDAKTPLPVVVHIAQTELRIGMDPSIEPAPNMYGLVGALMAGAMESGQSKKARAELEPLLTALGDFDASGPLMAGIRNGVSDIPWLRLETPAPLRDNSVEAKNVLLDKISGNHLIDVDCAYNVGQAFEAIFTRCTIQIAEKQMADTSPSNRWKPGRLLLDRFVQADVVLDTSAVSPSLPHCFGSERRPLCRAKWAENAAALMRKELGTALEKLGRLVARDISLTETEVDIPSQPQASVAVLAFYHVGPIFEGAENVGDPGRTTTFFSGAKLAVLKPDSDGATIIQEGGRLYHKRIATVR